ncbi:MAG TPA: hypothetical protein VGF18_09970 [Candidatus Tumulicola sp.]|jgi:hypothetical protein
MRVTKFVLIAGVAASTLAVPAGAALANGYSGTYPVTVSGSQRSNGTWCLTLEDDGSQRYRHSGFATLAIGTKKYTYGTFQVINRTLVATIEAQGYGQNASLLFIAPASHDAIGKGLFEDAYGGEDFDSGALAFGAKNGC